MQTRIGISSVNHAVRTLETKSIHGYYALARPMHSGWVYLERSDSPAADHIVLNQDEVIVIAGSKDQILKDYQVHGPVTMAFQIGESSNALTDGCCVTIFHQRRLFRDNYWAVMLSAGAVKFGKPGKSGSNDGISVSDKTGVMRVMREAFAGQGHMVRKV